MNIFVRFQLSSETSADASMTIAISFETSGEQLSEIQI